MIIEKDLEKIYTLLTDSIGLCDAEIPNFLEVAAKKFKVLSMEKSREKSITDCLTENIINTLGAYTKAVNDLHKYEDDKILSLFKDFDKVTASHIVTTLNFDNSSYWDGEEKVSGALHRLVKSGVLSVNSFMVYKLR